MLMEAAAAERQQQREREQRQQRAPPPRRRLKQTAARVAAQLQQPAVPQQAVLLQRIQAAMIPQQLSKMRVLQQRLKRRTRGAAAWLDTMGQQSAQQRAALWWAATVARCRPSQAAAALVRVLAPEPALVRAELPNQQVQTVSAAPRQPVRQQLHWLLRRQLR